MFATGTNPAAIHSGDHPKSRSLRIDTGIHAIAPIAITIAVLHRENTGYTPSNSNLAK